MSKELTEIIEENGMYYNIGKHGLMRWEYLQMNYRREYLRLLLDGKLNEYLHEVDKECHARVELLVEQMKAGAGITEELKASDQMKWIGLMNNVRITAEGIVQREMVYV
ncbi:MAG: TnpV protein [Eubacterium sp.]|nr:TnpV protein [Eubacterium sp.]